MACGRSLVQIRLALLQLSLTAVRVQVDFNSLNCPPGYECKYQVVPEESVALYVVKAAVAEVSLDKILDVIWSAGQIIGGSLRSYRLRAKLHLASSGPCKVVPAI